MTSSPDNDPDFVYDEWIESRRKPPDVRLDESVLELLSSEASHRSSPGVSTPAHQSSRETPAAELRSVNQSSRETPAAELRPIEPEHRWTLKAMLVQAAQMLAVAAAVAVCVTRVCLVIFPFGELH